MKRHSPSKKRFMEPNTTQTPNYYFDVILPLPLTLAELKIINAVIRETYGWGESSWEMSISDLVRKTGLERANVTRAAARLTMGSDRLPALLGRKLNRSGIYVYWLLMNKSVPSAVADGSEPDFDHLTRGVATTTGVVSQHARLLVSQHAQPKEERKALKPKSKKVDKSSSPKEPTADDGDVFVSALASMPEIKKLAIRKIFVMLSNGTAWKETRDGAAYAQIADIPEPVIAMGLCYCVAKSPGHRIGSLSYAVKEIERFNKEIGGMDAEQLCNLADREMDKTRKCIEWGKWELSEMTAEQQEQILPRRGRNRVAS